MKASDLVRYYDLVITDHLLNSIVEFDNRSDYFSYRAKGFFGFLLRSPVPIEQLIHKTVSVLATARLSKTENEPVISGFVFTIRETEERGPKVKLEFQIIPGNFILLENSETHYVFNDKKADVRGIIKIVLTN